jgi:O-antigen ligase
MAGDNPIFGWGAGSFRYVFPIYQKEYDILWYYYYREDRGWIGRKIYNYSHNDWVQFLAEYGLVGCSMLLSMFLCLLNVLRKTFYFNKITGVFLLCGLFVIITHNLVDFIFSSPAYWCAFWGSIFCLKKVFFVNYKSQVQFNIKT